MTVEFWFLIGAALVFWMQAGFAMCETGFTRAKNAGNILMKNLMDFCIGTVVFSLLGYTLMMGEDTLFGLIGRPNLDLFLHFREFIASPADGGFTGASTFVFNLVFCATTATIVSGAMAERTKFSAYCIYSAVISLVVYPIEAHWIWGGGWLSRLGFHDYAGSCAIHMVGGIAALIGAIWLGPRIGKYKTDAGGKIIKVNAIPGHNLPLAALGVFILWLGWYGFNGAAAATPSELASIFLTTTIAPSLATCTTMIFTWVKNGKPDVSMCLNAALAGLVGVTAGCDAVDALGAGIIGVVSGLLVVVFVERLDIKRHIDDPVGAVGVHMANGVWGTLAVGLLANPDAPAGLRGLFYTGSLAQLGLQLAGVLSVGVWTAVCMVIFYSAIKRFHGLRASAEDELGGLDASEHGLPSAYADFAPAVEKYTAWAPADDAHRGRYRTDARGGGDPCEKGPGLRHARRTQVHQGGDRVPRIPPVRPQGGHGPTRRHGHDRLPRHGLRNAEGQAGVLPRRRDRDEPHAQGAGGHRHQQGPRPGRDRDGEEGAVHRPYRGRQDLRVRRGERGPDPHRRGGL